MKRGRPPKDAPSRTVRLHMLLSEDERAMLTGLAAAEGLTWSDVVRQLIRRAHGKARS